MQNKNDSIIETTGVIVSSYLQKNFIDAESLPSFVQSILEILQSVPDDRVAPTNRLGDQSGTNISGALSKRSSFLSHKINLIPAVPIEKSVTPEYIICLEDGKKFKSLKRHLKSYYNITPDEYRKKWNLPDSYPMVSPNYAVLRSKLAKKIHLGSKISED